MHQESPPLVAVVTPVYNGGAFLDATMAAVQAQTYPHLVHVVLDNASTDDTPAIIARYANGRAPVAAHRNASLLNQDDNWNAALGKAPEGARYIRILCADDTMTPDSIAKLVALAEAHPGVGLVGSHHNRGGATEPSNWPGDAQTFAGREALQRILLGQSMLIAPHTLMRRTAMETPFIRSGLSAADTEACLRILRRHDFGFVPEDLAMTRMHEGSMTSALVEATEIQFFEWLELLDAFGAEAFGEEAPRIGKRYRRHYWRALLKWRLRGRDGAARANLAALKKRGAAPGVFDYLDAALDWAACRAGLSTPWRGYPF